MNPGTTRRAVAFFTGGVAALIALALLAGGVLLLVADGRKEADGYLTSAPHRFATATYALTSGNADLNLHAPRWLVDANDLGTVRLKATSADGRPLFVGIAPTRDVAAYLARTEHAELRDLDYLPFHVAYRTHPGTERPLPPGRQRFWVASGRRSLTWKVRRGQWSVVVMNADGSPGVTARVSAAATVPFVGDVGWWTLAGGLLALGAAAGLVVVGARAGRRTLVAA